MISLETGLRFAPQPIDLHTEYLDQQSCAAMANSKIVWNDVQRANTINRIRETIRPVAG